jgi:hypothetical protein
MGPVGTVIAADAPKGEDKGKDKKGGKGKNEGEEGPAQAGPPLLSICSSLQLQERQGQNGAGGSVTAAMTGTTVLWRDATALALGLLLFGRGIEVSLTWASVGSGGARDAAVPDNGSAATASGTMAVVAAVFDPRGTDPLTLAPTFITLKDLRRVNEVRMRISAKLSSSDLGYGAAQMGAGGVIGGNTSGANSTAGIQAELLDILGIGQGAGRADADIVAAGARGRFNVIVTDFGGPVKGLPVLAQPLPLPTVKATGARGGAIDARRGRGGKAVRAPVAPPAAPVISMEETVECFLLSPLRTIDGDCTGLGSNGAPSASRMGAESAGRPRPSGTAPPGAPTVVRNYSQNGPTSSNGVLSDFWGSGGDGSGHTGAGLRVTSGGQGQRQVRPTHEFYDDESDDTAELAGMRSGNGGRGGGGAGRGGGRGGQSGRGGRGGKSGGEGGRDKGKREGGGGGRGGKKSGVEKAIAQNQISSRSSREAQASEILEARRKAEVDQQKKREQDLMKNSFAVKQAQMEKEAMARAKGTAPKGK